MSSRQKRALGILLYMIIAGAIVGGLAYVNPVLGLLGGLVASYLIISETMKQTVILAEEWRRTVERESKTIE